MSLRSRGTCQRDLRCTLRPQSSSKVSLNLLIVFLTEKSTNVKQTMIICSDMKQISLGWNKIDEKEIKDALQSESDSEEEKDLFIWEPLETHLSFKEDEYI